MVILLQLSNKTKVVYLVILTILICAMAGGVAYFGVQANYRSSEIDSIKKALENAGLSADHDLSKLQEQVEAQGEQKASMEQQLKDNQSKIQSMEQVISGLNSRLENGGKPSAIPVYGKVCYLTFDDGPSANTLNILDILKKENVPATFFVIHSSHKDYLKKIADGGHAIGLHTYSHDYAKIYQSDQAYYEDLQKISDEVESVVGYAPKIMRFPGGASNTISKKYNKGIMSRITQGVEDRGYVYFDWNCNSGDADKNNVPASSLVESVKKSAGSQRVLNLLMHDSPAKSTTVQALPQIISYLKSQGYRFEKLTIETPPVHQKVGN